MPRKTSTRKNANFSLQKEFYSDLTIDKMLYAVTVRSPVSEGIITAISHPDLPEGYTLVTARDISGPNLLDTPRGKIPVFCEGNVSYSGEPLGLLVGPDETMLKQILNELNFTIDTNTIEDYLPDEEIISMENTTEEKSKREIKKAEKEIEEIKQIKEDFFSNTIAEREFQWGKCFESKENQIENFEKIFDTSKFKFEKEWIYAIKIKNYGEPNGALCYWKDGTLTIFTPSLWLNNLRSNLATVLAVKTDAINIKKTTSTNTGTNSIWYNSIIACQCAVASKKVNAPIKLVYSRTEQEQFLDTVQPISIFHRTACDEKGIIQAMDIKIKVDAGFTNPFAQEIIDRLVIAGNGCYRTKNIRIRAEAQKSLNSSSSLDIQSIDAASFYAVENQMNCMAKMCNMSPVDFRIINSRFENLDKKKKDLYPLTLNIEKMAETLQALARISDFNRKHSSYHLDSQNWKFNSAPKEYVSVFSPPMRGIGIACAFEGSGYFGSEVYENNQSLEMTMENEHTIVVHCPSISTSIHEIWTNTAREILGNENIILKTNSNFNEKEEPTLPESIYSNISKMTLLLKQCCTAIKKRKNQNEYPYTVKKKVPSTFMQKWDQKNFTGTPFHSTSFACASIELELNPCTYREEIRNVCIIINGGKILNTQAATSSIRLAVQKIFNSLIDDETIEVQNLKISFIQSEENPCQIGELVYHLIPSAYSQALSQALNCEINYLPLKADSIFEKIREQKKLLKEIEEKKKTAEEKNDSKDESRKDN